MKKKILIGLALMLSMILLAVPVFAAGGSATVSSTSGNPGETAYLTVSVSGFEQADSVSIVVSGLTLDAAKSSWLQEGMLSDFSSNAGVWAAGEAMDINGDVAKLAFTVPDPAANGGKWESEVSVAVRVKNDTEDLGSFTAVGKITVICSHENLTETPAKPASCTAPGNNQYFTCQACGKILAADKTTVTTVEEQLIPQLEHEWDAGVITKEPTEDEEGTKLFTCERCGETREETLPKLDHVHAYTSVVTEPTCTEKGYTTHTCKCGHSYTDNEIDALGHKWDAGVIIEKPTEDAGTPPADGIVKGIVTPNELTIREGAGSNYDRIGSYFKGDEIVILEMKVVGETTWGRTNRGWVSMHYVWIANQEDSKATMLRAGTQTGIILYTCERCGATKEEPLPEQEPLPEAEVAVARMILGNELAMQFAFLKENIVEGVEYVVSVTKTYADGREDKNILVPQSEWKTNGPYYYVSFNGIAAKEMGDTINVQILTADGVTVGDVYTDSVQNYAIRQLQKTTHAKTRTLYVDMLNYGAAAQTYFKYDAENLVTDELTETEKGYGTKEVKLENNLVKGPGYGASQLNLASSIQLRVKFNGIDSSMYAIVKFTNHMGREIEARVEGSEFMYSGTVVVIDDVVAADYDRDVTITVYDADGKAVASAVESVASYIARMSGGAEIYSAVAKYCAAAYGYLHK